MPSENGKEDFAEQLDDLMDTLDIKSSEKKSADEEESATREASEEEVEEEAEGGEEEVLDGLEDGEEPETAEEEERAVAEIEEEEIEEVATAEDEMALIKEQNKKLLARLEEVTEARLRAPQEPEPKAPRVEPTPTEPAPVVATAETLLGDLDIDDVVSDPKLFQQVLNKHADMVRNQVTEQVYRSIPSLVIQQIQQQTAIKEAVDQFYDQNPDLVVVKRTVGTIANEIAADDPSKSLEVVFDEAAIKTREILGLQKVAKQQGSGLQSRVRKPALRRPTGRRSSNIGPSLSDMEQDVLDTVITN